MTKTTPAYTQIPILIVDDNPDNIFSLTILLQRNGFLTESAQSGEEALEKMLRENFGLVLLDVQMPEMDGFEVAGFMKGNKKTRHIPIIFISALATEKDFFKKGLETGAIDYITKPFDSELLLLKVHNLLKLSFAEQELIKANQQLESSRRRMEKKAESAIFSFDSIFQNSPDLMLILDQNIRIVDCNRDWLYGKTLPKHELIGKNLTDLTFQFVTPPPYPSYQEFFQHVFNTKDFNPILEIEVLVKGKGKIYYETAFTRILDLERNELMLATFKNVTERITQQLEILRSYQEISNFKQALDQSTAVIITDLDGNILEANERIESISGYQCKELIGQHTRIFNSGHHPASYYHHMWQTIKSGKIWRNEIVNKAKDGTLFWLDMSIVPMKNETGQITRFLATRIDISDRKINEAELGKQAFLLNTLSVINTQLLKMDDFNHTLEDIFSQIGQSLDVDRVYYFVNHVNSINSELGCSQIIEWCDESIEPQINNPKLQNLSYRLIPEIYAMLNNGQTFGSLISDIQNDAFRKTLEEQKIKAITFCPLIVNGLFYGFIGVDECRRERKWTQNEWEFLKTFSANLSSVISEMQAKKRLEDIYNERNNILESIGDAFLSINDQWIITYWNKHAEEITRYSSSEALGENLWDLFPQYADSQINSQFQDAMNKKITKHFEYYFPERKIWLDVSAYPSVSGLSVYLSNITQRKSNEEKLAAYAKELARSNQELEHFAYVASHDMQEPLRMVTNFMARLDDMYGSQLDEKGKTYIYYAVDGAKRMRKIIQDLLEYSRAGQIKSKTENLDLNDIIQEIQTLHRNIIEEKNASIQYSHLPVIHSYRAPVKQLFHNLINNALKYSQQDNEPIIQIQATEKESEWLFSIQDNGIGIAEEHHEKIFTLFNRLHSREAYSGSGIGLAIVKKIIGNLGGEIGLQSTINSGTTFFFTLPKEHHNIRQH